MNRSVLFLTGSRSEYDILAPVVGAVRAKRGLEAGLIVTGAHLSPEYGLSVRQIEADGFRIVARLESLLSSDTLVGRVKGAALQLAGLAEILARESPSFLVVMGDREESITGAMSAVYLNIPVVHIGGGDHAEDGNVDNLVRHAVTKLAHLHMAASAASANRLRDLGEEAWRIHTVGAPGIDRILQTPHLDRATLFRELGVDWCADPAVVIYHPTIRDFHEAKAHMEMILRTVAATDLPVAIVYPNSDPGNRGIIQTIEDFVADEPNRRAFPYLPRTAFVNLLRHARVLVGNSSAGLLEAPSLKLPVVNIGLRQTGREAGDNVLFVGYDSDAIAGALHRALDDDAFQKAVRHGRNPYGDGHAGMRIADVLQHVDLGERLMKKRLVAHERG